ncbi:hypothetical protein IKO50_06245 [bacterium]|nr:hypothetical protein [bacterium]
MADQLHELLILEIHEHDEIQQYDESEIIELRVEKEHDEIRLHQHDEEQLHQHDESEIRQVKVEDEEEKSKRFLKSL